MPTRRKETPVEDEIDNLIDQVENLILLRTIKDAIKRKLGEKY